MKKALKKLLLSVTLIAVLTATATATDLQNIEKITPQGSQNINITGTVDMKGNPITDTSGDLTLNGGNVNIPDGNININGVFEAGNTGGTSGFLSFKNTEIREDNSQNIILANGDVEVPDGNLAVSGRTDGVDLDNPGTAITVNSNQYEVTDSSISVTELDTGSTDSRYVNRGGDTMTGGLDIEASSNPVLTYGDGAGKGHLIAGSTWTGLRTGDGTNALKLYQSSQDVEIPNGALDVSGQLTVGSTECGTGEYIDGDGSCTDVVSETSGEYVNEGGDSINGNLDLNYNQVGNVSKLDLSTSSTDIASFSSTGIDFNQPLSLDSPGPLSVSNGVQLTGTSSNTLESYSTLYLETSSGSPSDIVLDPTGEVGIDSNLSVEGDIDLGSSGAIKTGATDAVRIDSNRNVKVPNGDLSIGDSQSIKLGGSGVEIAGYPSSNYAALKDTNGNDVLRWKNSDNNIYIPNGKLDLGSNRIQSIGSSEVNFRSSGSLDLEGESITNANQIISNSDALARVQLSSGVDLEVGDGGGSRIDALRTENGGSVEIPNGNLDVNGNIEASNKLTLTGGGAGEDAILHTTGDGAFYIENYQNGGQENAKLGLVDSSGTNTYLQARSGTIGPKNANLRLNSGYSIENGGGTESITLDSSANVKLPNGNLIVPQGNSITDDNGNDRLEVGSSTVIKGGGSASVTVATNSVNIRGSTNSRAVILGGGGTDYMRLSNDGSQNVEIPSGNLDMKSNNINNIGTSNVDMVYDSNDDRVEMRSNGQEDICIGNCGA